MKAVIVHGWGGSPKSDWYNWLRKELENRDWDVEVPEMPETMVPKIDKWVEQLKKAAGKVDENTYFIGHSIGCQTILRYLENLKGKAGGCILVAGWFNLTENTWDENYTHEIADPWLNTEIDLDKVKKKCRKIVAVFSNNDPYVPLTDKEIYKEKLGAEIIILEGKGHVSGEDGVKQLPIVLDKLLEMAKVK